MHAAEDDGLRLRFGGLFCEVIRIPHPVGDRLYRVRRIVMRKYDRFFPLFERAESLLYLLHIQPA